MRGGAGIPHQTFVATADFAGLYDNGLSGWSLGCLLDNRQSCLHPLIPDLDHLQISRDLATWPSGGGPSFASQPTSRVGCLQDVNTADYEEVGLK